MYFRLAPGDKLRVKASRVNLSNALAAHSNSNRNKSNLLLYPLNLVHLYKAIQISLLSRDENLSWLHPARCSRCPNRLDSI